MLAAAVSVARWLRVAVVAVVAMESVWCRTRGDGGGGCVVVSSSSSLCSRVFVFLPMLLGVLGELVAAQEG